MLLTTSAAQPVAATVPARYAHADWTAIQPEALAAFDAERGLILTGPTGRGKTYSLCALALSLKPPGAFVDWSAFLSTIRAWWRLKGDDAAKFDPMRWATREPALFVDDVGTEAVPFGGRPNPNDDLGLEMFPALVNDRYNRALPLYVSTNLTAADLAARYGPRTISRIVETCDWVELTGPDRRVEA